MYPVPSPLPLHDVVAITYHASMDAFGLLANVILFFAILLKSPSSLKSVRPVSSSHGSHFVF